MINARALKAPTAEECSQNSQVYEDEFHWGYAIWYPQMGGYVGMAVAVCDKEHEEGVGGCFEVYVWHDGEFPFNDNEDGKIPAHLHHCMAEQFIGFGEQLAALNERGRRKKA